MKIYIDESGDLGFTEKSSKFFVVSSLIPKDIIAIKKCLTKVRKQKLMKKYKEISELKFHNSNKDIRRRILQCISKCDVEIDYVILRKSEVKEELKNNPKILYNFMVGNLITRILEKNKTSKLEVIIDKSLYGISKANFDEYITYKILLSDKDKSLSSKNIQIIHADSKQEHCIQAVDFVAGAILRSYENENFYYDLIKNKIKISLNLFDKNNVENPSILRPTRLKSASYFSGRTYLPRLIMDYILYKTYENQFNNNFMEVSHGRNVG